MPSMKWKCHLSSQYDAISGQRARHCLSDVCDGSVEEQLTDLV
jgi:hypothetical protein